MVTRLALFVLYDWFPRLTAELRGSAYYRQQLTVVTVLLVYMAYRAVIDVCGISKEINATLE